MSFKKFRRLCRVTRDLRREEPAAAAVSRALEWGKVHPHNIPVLRKIILKYNWGDRVEATRRFWAVQGDLTMAA